MEMCGTLTTPNAAEAYYCDIESKRQKFEKNYKTTMAIAVVSTAVTGIAGLASVLFYLNPDWFGTDEKKTAMVISPSVGPQFQGFVLTGKF